MITSVKNERVKGWKKLHVRKSRYEKQQFLIEGFHLLEEAWKSGWNIKEIILKEDVNIPDVFKTHEIIEVSSSVFKQIAQTDSPQGILAVVAMKTFNEPVANRMLIVDAVQDPGNLGTIIRTADAAGYHVVLGDGTVDVYNEKVIRATQGSIFHTPIAHRNLMTCIKELKGKGFKIVSSALKNAVPYHIMDAPEKMALMVGNEGSGINKDFIALADANIYIPIYGDAESLNVSVAAGILMYYFS